jgi:hypothetical protein
MQHPFGGARPGLVEVKIDTTDGRIRRNVLAAASCNYPHNTNGEGAIRTRSLRYSLENKHLEHNPLFYNELRATLRYHTHTVPTLFVTPRIGRYVGQSREVPRSHKRFPLPLFPRDANSRHPKTGQGRHRNPQPQLTRVPHSSPRPGTQTGQSFP